MFRVFPGPTTRPAKDSFTAIAPYARACLGMEGFPRGSWLPMEQTENQSRRVSGLRLIGWRTAGSALAGLRPGRARRAARTLLKPSDGDVAEGHPIVVAGEPEVPRCAVLAGVRIVPHELGHPAQVTVQDHRTVELDPQG
jgi:hypothetical protein